MSNESLDGRNLAEDKRRLVARVIREMTANGSWSGETHTQKAVFHLKTLFLPSLDFKFYLHMYGPYSRDVNDTLQYMMGFGEIEFEADPPYGPHIRLTERGERLASGEDDESALVAWVAQQLQDRGVDQLEGPATAGLLLSEPGWKVDDLASEIHRLKRHISVEDAKKAIVEFKALRAAALAFERSVANSRAEPVSQPSGD